MSKDAIKLNAARATAIAAVNTTVQHMFLGLFMSEFKCDKWYQPYNGDLGNAIKCRIDGRTDKGTFVDASCVLFLGKSDSEMYDFPFSKIYVSVFDPDAKLGVDELFLYDGNTYFEYCRYKENCEWKFMLVQLEECPY